MKPLAIFLNTYPDFFTRLNSSFYLSNEFFKSNPGIQNPVTRPSLPDEYAAMAIYGGVSSVYQYPAELGYVEQERQSPLEARAVRHDDLEPTKGNRRLTWDFDLAHNVLQRHADPLTIHEQVTMSADFVAGLSN